MRTLTMTVIVGWDIGGVHLKAVRTEGGRIVEALQLPSPLRHGLDALNAAFAEATARMGTADRHVITMTGELADTFASRAEGVDQLVALAMRALAPASVALYAGRVGFVRPELASRHVEDIASANWYATATFVASVRPAALFVDMGSTTTDIVPIIDGTVAARGYTDAQRLAVGELVYTGLTRSFVMAIADGAPFAGRWVGLIKENFATMADVHRILGAVPEAADQMATADGRAKTIEASRARLARMVGHDAADGSDAVWTGLAQWLAEAQIRTIHDGAMLVLSAARMPKEAPIVSAGIGEAIVREVARRLGRACIGIDTLFEATPEIRPRAAQCAPAAALALIAAKVPNS
jgi:(4-(4-[2-(gamma-L-glutamylamino)ethyl]phenoxymethyl)furan-2-yl)methanamine synthase